jgi:hypothetical protein
MSSATPLLRVLVHCHDQVSLFLELCDDWDEDIPRWHPLQIGLDVSNVQIYSPLQHVRTYS